MFIVYIFKQSFYLDRALFIKFKIHIHSYIFLVWANLNHLIMLQNKQNNQWRRLKTPVKN